MSDSRYLSAKEVAERYGLSVNWVYGCRTLPRRKVGKYLRFLESDLEQWEKKLPESIRTFNWHLVEPVGVGVRSMSHKHNSDRYDEDGKLVLSFDIL